jgi:hypothetical protein
VRAREFWTSVPGAQVRGTGGTLICISDSKPRSPKARDRGHPADAHLLPGAEVHFLELRSMLNACLFNSVLYCCFKYVYFYIC